MISKLSNKLADNLLLKQSITDEERELYAYGFFSMLSFIICLILASFFGILLHCFLESIVFYIAFQFIRRYAGGYHASSEKTCEILSTFSIFSSILLVKVSNYYEFQTILLIISVVLSIVIFFISPLDTPAKPLSEEQIKQYRKKTRIILITIVTVTLITHFLKIFTVSTPCCVSIVLECILLVFGKVKQKNHSVVSP